MAEKIGDSAFAAKCREWIEAGTQLLEEKLWGDGYYLSSLDEASGKRTELVLAFQLDGEWIARLHGLPSVFRPERVSSTLATIKRLNSWVPLNGVIDVIQPDGHLTEFGGRMGWMASMPASVLILAMTYLYAGQPAEGLDVAFKCLNSIVNRFEMTWDVPNIVRLRSRCRTAAGHHAHLRYRLLPVPQYLGITVGVEGRRFAAGRCAGWACLQDHRCHALGGLPIN